MNIQAIENNQLKISITVIIMYFAVCITSIIWTPWENAISEYTESISFIERLTFKGLLYGIYDIATLIFYIVKGNFNNAVVPMIMTMLALFKLTAKFTDGILNYIHDGIIKTIIQYCLNSIMSYGVSMFTYYFLLNLYNMLTEFMKNPEQNFVIIAVILLPITYGLIFYPALTQFIDLFFYSIGIAFFYIIIDKSQYIAIFPQKVIISVVFSIVFFITTIILSNKFSEKLDEFENKLLNKLSDKPYGFLIWGIIFFIWFSRKV